MKNIFCNQEKKIKYRLFDKTEKLNAGHWLLSRIAQSFKHSNSPNLDLNYNFWGTQKYLLAVKYSERRSHYTLYTVCNGFQS